MSMSYRRGMKTAEQFQNQSSNNMLSLTRCEFAAQNACFDVFLKSVLLLNHYGQAIKPSTVRCKMACATAGGFTASSERATEFPESTESLGKSVDSPFCLLRPALG